MLKEKISVLLLLFLFSHVLSGCNSKEKDSFQGYIEAEYLYVASPFAGTLEELAVKRGQNVEAGTLLFILDHDNEADQVAEAEAKLQSAQFKFADLKKGKRPEELDVYRGQLDQAVASEKLAEIEFERDEKQYNIGAISQSQYDRARTNLQSARGKLAELRATLESGELPGRKDQRFAQIADAKAAEASLNQARWKLSQKTLNAPQSGFVFDTLYVKGEFVNAGRPVVVLLPPGNIKVRFFVPEVMVGGLRIGQKVEINCDGCPKGVNATISYISAQAEYTPPIIFSNETRSKLTFMIEAVFNPEESILLHPGLPVAVYLHG